VTSGAGGGSPSKGSVSAYEGLISQSILKRDYSGSRPGSEMERGTALGCRGSKRVRQGGPVGRSGVGAQQKEKRERG